MGKGNRRLSVILYSGTPGSGKSLHVADRIIWALRTGHYVISNFDINEKYIPKKKKELFMFRNNWEITPEFLIEFSTSKGRLPEDKILLVLDEAQLMFNAREWSAHGRNDWNMFFTQHRKWGYQIILVAQFDRMLDRYIRGVIEYEYIHRKLSNMGIRGWFLQSLFLSRKMFVCVKVWYQMNEKIDSEFFRFRRSRAKLYDTFNTFSAGLKEN